MTNQWDARERDSCCENSFRRYKGVAGGCGGIGRRAGFRIPFLKEYRFESDHPHHQELWYIAAEAFQHRPFEKSALCGVSAFRAVLTKGGRPGEERQHAQNEAPDKSQRDPTGGGALTDEANHPHPLPPTMTVAIPGLWAEFFGQQLS